MQNILMSYRAIKCNVRDDLLRQEEMNCFSSGTKFVLWARSMCTVTCFLKVNFAPYRDIKLSRQ